jgi:hypothetical protein
MYFLSAVENKYFSTVNAVGCPYAHRRLGIAIDWSSELFTEGEAVVPNGGFAFHDNHGDGSVPCVRVVQERFDPQKQHVIHLGSRSTFLCRNS